MKQLSLDNLRTFVTVIDAGGYAKAGDILARSQPAISLQIKKLEEQLGKRLFEKIGQRHQVNEDGRQLYAYAEQMLQLNDQVFAQFTQENLRGKLRLGIPSEFATTLLPSIVGEFSQRYPEVSLEVTSALSKSLLSSSQRDDFDIVMALMNEDSTSTENVVLSDDLVWVSNGKPANQYSSFSLILAPDGCVYRSRVIQTLKQQPLGWRIAYTNADLSGISAAIQQGLGITALAKSSVPKELQVIRHKQLPSLGKVDICLFNQSKHHPQASLVLADFIKKKLLTS